MWLAAMHAEDATKTLDGYTAKTSETERAWETKFRALLSSDRQREYMRRLAAHPHHVGSPYDKDNAEWLLARFKEWGFDAHIENFDVLFPTPKQEKLEMLEPRRFEAKLKEPAVAVDPTSSQADEQLPAYNAYSIDGDVTGLLVYVNYGNAIARQCFVIDRHSVIDVNEQAGHVAVDRIGVIGGQLLVGL
jgi:N-acetylated-alpha-linked acidic dipeptidase